MEIDGSISDVPLEGWIRNSYELVFEGIDEVGVVKALKIVKYLLPTINFH